MATSKPTVPATTTPAATAGSPADIEATAAAVGHGLSRAVAGAQGHLAARAAPSTNLTSELNNIDFRKMIGGPLQAAVDAQVASSLATVNFINSVGFETADDGKKTLVMVDFSHTRKDVDAEGNEVNKDIAIRVPLLAMLPIPSLRIEHVIIDFKVKLNSVDVCRSYEAETLKLTGVEVKKEYALTVNVKAVQDEIPAGLEKILNMLAA